MYKELLMDFQNVLKQAKKSTKTVTNTINTTKSQLGLEQNSKNYFNPTEQYGKVVSFPKSQRFKPLVKEQLKTTDIHDIQLTSDKIISHSFNKSQRFSSDIKKSQEQQDIINPNYNFIKKNNTNVPIIKNSIKQQLLNKSKISLSTNNSQGGPAAYFIKQNDNIKKISFSKSKRFIDKKPINEDTPLIINETLIKKRPPSAILKQKIIKTKQLINKQKQQQIRQRLKMIYWNSIPLQIDRLYKNKIGPILRQKYFNIKKLKGTQKRCAILMFLDQINYLRGGFNLNLSSKLNQPCAVIYRKSTPKPFKFSDNEPGPDYYYPQDDIIKPNQKMFSFGKAEEKKPQPDNRDYQINEEIFKKGGNIIINPEHKSHILTQDQIKSLNRGPGYYDCLFGQVQKRDDIGMVKLPELNNNNARENNLYQKKEVNDLIYYPSYNGIDPNIEGPIYHQPANIKPPNISDKQLFPQHWLFYDGDLNKVRAQIGKNIILAKGMSYQQYQKYKDKFKAFQNYINSRKNQPQIGEYNVKYTQVDKHIPNYQLKKQGQRQINCQGIKKQQFGVDGDNLILSPQKLENHLPVIDFGKMLGRQEDVLPQDQAKEGDRLILNPLKIGKKLIDINFLKMISRPQTNEQKDQVPEGDRLIINPIYPQKHIANINMEKQIPRPQIKQREEEIYAIKQEKQQIIQLPKKLKGFVELGRWSSVKLVPHLRASKQKIQKDNN